MLRPALSPASPRSVLPAHLQRAAPRASLTQEATYGEPSLTSSVFPGDLQRLYGHVDDVDLTLGWDEKKQMMRDAHVSAAVHTAVLGAVARTAEVKAAPSNLHAGDAEAEMAEELAEFCRRNLVYIAQRHREIELTLFQVGTGALVVGNQKAEIVLELETQGVDKGKLTLSRVKSKPRETCAFVVDKQFNVRHIAAFTGAWEQLQTFNEMRMGSLNRIFGWGALEGNGWELLEREKFLVVTHKPPDTDSPEGTSALRPAYAPYRMKRNNWSYYLKALDFTALPFLWVEQPVGAAKMKPLLPNGQVNESAAPVAAGTVIYQAVSIARQGGVAVLPNGTKVNAVHNAASGDPHASATSVFNSEITMAILLQLLATGESRHMARAAGQVHQDVLDLVMRYVRRMLCGAVTRDVFGLLVRKNYPARYWHLVPTFSLGEVELNDFSAWALAFAKLNEAGLLHWSQFASVWNVLGLPQADMDKFLEEVERNQALISGMGAPEVAANGTPGPSQLQKYTEQETGKYLTRRSSRQIAGQNQAAFTTDTQDMQRKDISDETVCFAYLAAKEAGKKPLSLLQEWTGAPEKVCWRAMERADDHGLLDCGINLNSGWLTDKGVALLNSKTTSISPSP